MTTKRAPRPKRRMNTADAQLAKRVLAQLERVQDVINDPATPGETVQKIGAILEAFRYRRPPFTRRPKSFNL